MKTCTLSTTSDITNLYTFACAPSRDVFGAPCKMNAVYFIQGYMVSPQNASRIAVNI
jgi:hypothetical protein